MDDDWRIKPGDDQLMHGATVRWTAWRSEGPRDDHAHCQFCMVHFSDHVLPDDPDRRFEGYVTQDRHRYWICRRCFEDFKDRFEFVVVSS